MKIARPLAIGAATLLVAGSTLLAGTSATAADFYVEAGDFVAEVSPYPAQWFIGGGSTGTIASGVSGLNLNGTTGRIQILNGSPASTTDLGDLVNGADYTLVSGNANFQIPLFTNGAADTGYTTLRPDNFGPVGLNPLAGWTTSGAFGTFAAGSSHTIPEYEAELAARSLTPEILAFGLIAPLGENATVASISWDGNTHWFLPEPTAAISDASVTATELEETGVTATFTGFIPGETIDAGFGTGASGGALPGTFVADANGAVSILFQAANIAPGTGYTISASGATSSASAFIGFAVTADATATPPAAVPPVATLPVTGPDTTPFIIGGSVLLLAGASLIAAATVRRRAHAQD